MSDNRFHINSSQSLEEFTQLIIEEWKRDKFITVQWKKGKRRTNAQNNALAVYCRHLAEALNDAGYDMKRTLKQEIDIPWTEDKVRQFLWKPIQLIVINKESTTEANTDEYSKVYDVLNRQIATKFGVSVPFPSRETYEIEN